MPNICYRMKLFDVFDDDGDEEDDGSRMSGQAGPVTTPPISRKLSKGSPSEVPAPIISEFSNHTLPIHPPVGLAQRPLLCHCHSSLTKDFLWERDLWRDQSSVFTRKCPFLKASPGIQLYHL